MKSYLDKTVYDAAMGRVAFCFDTFEQVLISFSGGKDSSVCLNLFYDYAKDHGLLNKLGMYHLDFEAQYRMTTEYVENVFKSYPEMRKFWLCIPMKAGCVCRMDSAFWTPWDSKDKSIWVRDMPENEHVVNSENCPFEFDEDWTDNELQDRFATWYQDTFGKTALIIGIRADESYDRYKLVTSGSHSFDGKRIDGKRWTVAGKGFTRVYPIYDWTAEDDFVYFSRTCHEYNKLYDLFYKAGLNVDQMRVASPFNISAAAANLKLYKVIDPDTWGRMISRVNGVNFAGLYGDTTAMGWKNITKPKHFTWKQYCFFLLSTMDEKLREHYERILLTSVRFWCEKGGFVSPESIDQLSGMEFENLGESKRFKGQQIVRFKEYPDEIPATKDWASFPSYKRMCVCLLKNDYYCTYMGFGKTKEAIEKRRAALERYRSLL